ncbi:MAG: radical SAM protein [Candidatus Onthomonas sp.]
MERFMADITMEKELIQRAAQSRRPVSGTLELLPLCNMNCDMCYVRLSKGELEQQGRLRTAEEWLGLARQMQQAGVLFLLLTGGEPLLFPDFRRLYLELKRMGFILTINTNGTLIDEDWAAFFGANRPRRVNVTLYGADEATYQTLCHHPGGFFQTLRGIELLKKQGVDVKLNGSVTRHNAEDTAAIYQIAHELELPIHMDTYMLPGLRERGQVFALQSRLLPEQAAAAYVQTLKEEQAPGVFRQFAEQAVETARNPRPGFTGHMICQAGKSSFAINWQGQMRPCVSLPGPSIPVFEIGFAAAWKSIMEETEKITLSPKCSQCTLRRVCQTCAACALLETGSYEGVPEYMCRYTKEALRLLEEELERIKTEPVPDT